jgi:hypothetical protein
MLAALVLASWWAQAEPAPAAPAPAPAPLEEPAAPPPPAFKNRIAITGGYSLRTGDEGGRVGPRNGFSFSAGQEHVFVPRPHGPDFAAGVEVAYQKFSTGVTGTAMPSPGQTQAFSGDRVLSQTSFAATGSLSWRGGRLRLAVQLGAGLTVAYFSTPEMALSPGYLTAVQPLARAASGVDIALTPDIAVTIRVAYTHPFTRPTLTTDAGSGAPATYSFLGDLLDAGAGVALEF